MVIQNLPDESSHIKELLEKNLELTQEIFKMTKSIKSYIVWERVFGVIKLLLIVVPIILGVIYLPPLLKNVIGQYQSLLGTQGNSGSGGFKDLLKSLQSQSGAQNTNVKNLPSDIQKIIK